jgi:hypothetical protein
MTNSRPRILIIYPYSSLDTNPTMTFLLESLVKRNVWVDVLTGEREAFATPESFLTPEACPYGWRGDFFVQSEIPTIQFVLIPLFLNLAGPSNIP